MTRADILSLLCVIVFILALGGEWTTAAVAAAAFVLVSAPR